MNRRTIIVRSVNYLSSCINTYYIAMACIPSLIYSYTSNWRSSRTCQTRANSWRNPILRYSIYTHYYISYYSALNIIYSIAHYDIIAVGVQQCTRCMINTHLHVNIYYIIHDILVRHCTVEKNKSCSISLQSPKYYYDVYSNVKYDVSYSKTTGFRVRQFMGRRSSYTCRLLVSIY